MAWGRCVKPKVIKGEVRRRIGERHPEDEEIQDLLRSYERAEAILKRALWEFGSELRGEIEAYLDEEPMLPGSGS